ncbi:hypothetical protein V8F06_002239 [Rhypophila decipiens]
MEHCAGVGCCTYTQPALKSILCPVWRHAENVQASDALECHLPSSPTHIVSFQAVAGAEYDILLSPATPLSNADWITACDFHIFLFYFFGPFYVLIDGSRFAGFRGKKSIDELPAESSR